MKPGFQGLSFLCCVWRMLSQISSGRLTQQMGKNQAQSQSRLPGLLPLPSLGCLSVHFSASVPSQVISKNPNWDGLGNLQAFLKKCIMKTLCMNFKIVLHQNEFTFFSDVLICLFESQLQRDRETEKDRVHSPKGQQQRGGTRLKLGAESSIWVSPMALVIFPWFSKAISRQLGWKRSS